MANVNKAQIIKLCSDINKKEGEGSIYTIGSKHANLKINRWSTGIEDLDAIIGGGMPEGRTIEIFGPESSGKTTLLYHLMAMHDLALDIPVEGTFDADRAKVFGNRPKQLLVYRAKFGEDAMNKTIHFARAGIPVIGIDSVPSLVPKEDAEKVLKYLKDESFILAIASTTNDHTIDSYKKYNRNIIDKANLEDIFSIIYSKGAVKELKPNPEIHYKILNELNVNAEECLIVEDSLIGVEAANNANIEVAVIYDKYSDCDREKINELTQYKFADFKEMLDLIKN